MVKIAIVDDHSLFRTGVKLSLQSRPDIQIVAEAENGLQLLNLLQHIKVDIVLLDIQMPVLDGLSTLPEVKRLYPDVKVIILSMHNDQSVISKMMQLGASSYLTKESGSKLIYEAIIGVYKNGAFFTEQTNQAFIKSLVSNETEEYYKFSLVDLSEKELIALRMLCNKNTSNEIAETVNLSIKDVEIIKKKLLLKTGCKSVEELNMYSQRVGIIDEKMENAISELTKPELVNMFTIMNSILSFVNHDLAGQRSLVYNYLDQINEIINNIESEIDRSQIADVTKKALEATRAISSINKLIKLYANSIRTSDLNKLFVTHPYKLLDLIAERNTNMKLAIETKDPTLRFIYPNVVLYSTLSELVENAKKNSQGNLEIYINWSMKGNTFICEVHDNGPGFLGIQINQNVTMSRLQLLESGMGLKIIDRTIMESRGKLFFSKSARLGGAKIYIEIPTIKYVS